MLRALLGWYWEESARYLLLAQDQKSRPSPYPPEVSRLGRALPFSHRLARNSDQRAASWQF